MYLTFLLLTLQVLSTTASHFYGGSMTFNSRSNFDGSYKVELRFKTAYHHCSSYDYWTCWSGNCGIENSYEMGKIDSSVNGGNWCQSEGIITRTVSTNDPFELINQDCCWIYNTVTTGGPWSLLTHIDLGVRSDTSKPNRSPITTTLPFLRVPQNCPRRFNLLAFDPDGDHVRCRYGLGSNNECGICNQPAGFTLDQNQCSLSYGHTSLTGVYSFELVLEDFPMQTITLSYTNQPSVTRDPVSLNRARRMVRSIDLNYTTTVAPTTVAVAPPTTTIAVTTITNPQTTTTVPLTTTTCGSCKTTIPSTTTTVPSTKTTVPPTNTTCGSCKTTIPSTTTTVPSTKTTVPSTKTTVPPTNTTCGSCKTTIPSTTTTVPSTKTTVPPTNTTCGSCKTTIPSTTTTVPPTTSTVPPTKTTCGSCKTPVSSTTTPVSSTTTPVPSTTTPVPSTTTPVPSTTTPVTPTTTPVTPTTTPVTPTITTVLPTTTTVPTVPLSKIPLQFSLQVDSPALSCTEGEYLPQFLHPTPQHREHLQARVYEEIEIRINAFAYISSITDVIISGPLHSTKHKATTGEYVINWTPTPENHGQHFPFCFIAEGQDGSNIYQSEMRCVIVEVDEIALTTTTVAPTTTTVAPTTTTVAQTTTTVAPTTTTVAPTTTTVAPTTTTVAPTTTTVAPTTTTVAPTTTTVATTTVAPTTTTVAPTTTTVAPTTTTVAPTTTTVAPTTTTVAPTTTTVAPTTTTYASTLPGPKAHVTCLQNSMSVSVEKSTIKNINNKHLRLIDPSCQPNSNETHVFISIPLNGCGTEMKETNDNLIFKNKIISYDDPRDIITRKHELEIEFLCKYRKRSNLTMEFDTRRPGINFTEIGFGAFSYEFEFYQSADFYNEIDPNSYPLEYDLGEMIYMQIEPITPVQNTEIFLESCVATPYDNPNYPISYPIITNGCIVDETVQIFSNHQPYIEFGLEAFKFIGLHDQVFISCSIIICEANNPLTRCSKGCTNIPISPLSHHLQKREAPIQTTSHFISQGPLRLRRESQVTVSQGVNLNLLVIAGCLLATAAMVCGVLVYRLRMSRVRYQPVPSHEI
ncbi:uncharacterized protein [Paramisgurnus dabryanus]|uniref:uncharacterized protein n=1 Tax=Paramisgurnus dabryanus TaxID=90735 RepID=UPI0031F43024